MTIESDEGDFFMLGQSAYECELSMEEMVTDLNKRFARRFSAKPPASIVQAMLEGWFSMKETKEDYNDEY